MNTRFEIYIAANISDIEHIKQAIELELQKISGTTVENVNSIESKGINAKEIGLSFVISVAAGLTANALQDHVEDAINNIVKQEDVVTKITVTPLSEKIEKK